MTDYPPYYALPETWAMLPAWVRKTGKDILREYTSGALQVFADLLAEHVADEAVSHYWRTVGEVLVALEVMAKDPLMRCTVKRISMLEKGQRSGSHAFVAAGVEFELGWMVGPRGGLGVGLSIPSEGMTFYTAYAGRLDMNEGRARFAQARAMARFFCKHMRKEPTGC